MKITLDLDRLLEEGKITPDEYARLESLAARETASLALNVLVAFGVVAVAGSMLALLRSAGAGIALGIAMSASGVYVARARSQQWQPLGAILLLIGSLTAGGGIISITDGSPGGFALLSVAFAGVSLVARSGLLAALCALSLLSASGGITGYTHAAYFLGIEHPLLTVTLFGILSFAAYRGSLVVSAEYSRLAIVFSRTSLFIVNLGFWIGTLWGDPLWTDRASPETGASPLLADWVFVVTWAVGLIAVGTWAANRNRRWVVNIVTVFGAIHFYTQYFEWLGADAGSVLVAGLVALGIAFGLMRYNRRERSASPESV